MKNFYSYQIVIMSDFFGEKRGMIIGARLAGESMFRTTKLVDVSRTTLSRAMTGYTNLRKVFPKKHNNGRKLKLNGHDSQVLKRISQEYTSTDNVRDEYLKPKTRSHENCLTRVACCVYS